MMDFIEKQKYKKYGVPLLFLFNNQSFKLR